MMKRMKEWLKQLAGKKCEGGAMVLMPSILILIMVLIGLVVVFKEPIIAAIESVM